MSASVYRSIINDYHDELKKRVQADTEKELKSFSNGFYGRRQSLAVASTQRRVSLSNMDESKTNASFMLKRRLDSLLNVVKEARVANLTNLSNFDNIEELSYLDEEKLKERLFVIHVFPFEYKTVFRLMVCTDGYMNEKQQALVHACAKTGSIHLFAEKEFSEFFAEFTAHESAEIKFSLKMFQSEDFDRKLVYKFPRSLITEVERLEMNNFVVRMFKPETIIYFKQVKDVELCYDANTLASVLAMLEMLDGSTLLASSSHKLKSLGLRLTINKMNICFGEQNTREFQWHFDSLLMAMSMYNLKHFTVKNNFFSYQINLRASNLRLLVELRELCFIGFSVNQLMEEHLDQLQQLRELQLTECGIETVGGKAFCKLVHLEFLDLSKNRITSLISEQINQANSNPSEPFVQLGKLRRLDLSSNLIDKLPLGMFTGLVSLEQLCLRSNQIKSLDANGFDGMAQLKHLDLSSNLIERLDETAAFSGLAKLKTLHLHSNPCVRFLEQSSNVFLPLKMIERICLRANDMFTDK